MTERNEDMRDIPEERPPFGDWMRASPMKTISVTTMDKPRNRDNFSLRHKLFENFKKNIMDESELMHPRKDTSEGQNSGIRGC